MKVLIVDDEPLARDRVREFLKGEAGVEVVGECGNGREAIAAVRTHAPDLVFLDVQMPGMSGFEVLEAARGERMPFVIFVTAYDHHALRAFEYHALDYLLKPFDRERFRRALAYAREQTRRDARDDGGDNQGGRVLALLEELKRGASHLDWLTIRSGERTVVLRAADVEWIEAEGNYVRLNAAGGSHMLRETINNLEAQLDPRVFVRIHRSTIVNMSHVKELHAWARGEHRVVMRNGASLTLSRGYREHFDRFVKKRL